MKRTTLTMLAEWNTSLFGEMLGRAIQEPMTIGLIGDLGAGKTTFVRGLAKGLGVPSDYPITSPSFTIANIYPGSNFKLAHIDLYRLSSPDEFEGAGLEEFMSAPYVAAIEWYDRLPSVWHGRPERELVITFSFVDDNPNARQVVLETSTPELFDLVDSFVQN